MDFLYWALGIGFLVLVGFMAYVLYFLAQTLKSVKQVVDNAEDITQDVAKLKNSLKLGIFSLLSKVLKKRRWIDMADKKGSNVNPAAAAALGAVVGAAVGAAAVALSDDKNREKVSKKLDEYKKELGPEKFEALKKQGQSALEQFRKSIDDFRNKASDVVEEEKGEAQKKLAKPAKKVARS
jgi:uncharacterized membrane-anchored protein YhcB (DUF1043 family)